MRHPLDWIRRSLNAKILIIILASYILVSWATVETHMRILHPHRHGRKTDNIVNLCNYVIDDIGSPPDTLRAATIADRLGFGIRIVTGGYTWESAAGIPRLVDDDLEQHGLPNVRVGFDRGLQVAVLRENVRYEFLLQRREESIPYIGELLLAFQLLYTTLMLVVIYLGLRWQQRPLAVLHDAVTRVAAGELDFEIDSRRHDELGLMVRSFNGMRQAIVEMIESRDQLLLDVSHEFRSPLTRMRVSLEMMEESGERNNLIADIGELEAMVTEILESARLQSAHGALDLRETDLRDLLENVAAGYAERAPGIRLDLPGAAAVVTADAARVRMVLANIVANAIKYSPAEGRPVEASLAETPDNWTVTVRDYGCGIPEKELSFVFEPFYRVDKSRTKGTGGYGLGLHLARRIMEAHGGSIEMESREGEGTTVTLRFRRRHE